MRILRPLLPLFFLSMLGCAEKPAADTALFQARFVDVGTVLPQAQLDIRYSSTNNFLGVMVDGYEAPRCFLTREAAMALKGVQQELLAQGLTLRIFDGYRPQRAVDHFVRWARDLADTAMKAQYYPTVEKCHLFRDGFIAARSGHSRGSTVDLTIVSLSDSMAWDMGTDFDFFGPRSNMVSKEITPAQQQNRLFLKGLMAKHGFTHLPEEWWHYTLVDEPFPETYFNVPLN